MKIILTILVLTIGFHITGPYEHLMLWPIPSDEFRPWQLLTYTLLHGGVLHLVLNLIALLSFGPVLVREWGRARFLLCYVAAAVVGGGTHALMANGPTVGASAALFGLFAAYVMLNPRKPVVSLLPYPIAAWKVLAGYVLLSAAALTFHWLTMVAHAAHLGGAAVGIVFALAINNKPRR